ncbi:MAG: hypothetical protein OEY23_01510 [Acidimicrobiia bacterium]|nr:hypothetical protein [Acidimicrobiia bacterium]
MEHRSVAATFDIASRLRAAAGEWPTDPVRTTAPWLAGEVELRPLFAPASKGSVHDRGELSRAVGEFGFATARAELRFHTVLVDGLRAVLAGVVVGERLGDVGTSRAPLMIWADLDAERRARRIELDFDWDARRPDRSHDDAEPPPLAGASLEPPPPRSQGWYRNLVVRFAEAWPIDAAAGWASLLSDAARVSIEASGEIIDRAELAGVSPDRPTALEVVEVLGDGDRMAARLRMRDGVAPHRRRIDELGTPRGELALVARLDRNERVAELCAYGDVHELLGR